MDQAATPAPAGMGGMIIGYFDDFGAVSRTYGMAMVDGTVLLNETISVQPDGSRVASPSGGMITVQ